MNQQFTIDQEIEYRVTQRGKDAWRRGKIVNVDLSEENVYWVDVSDNTEHFEITRHADDIRPIPADELQTLHDENERLRTALNAISQEIVDWADFYKPLELNTTVALVARIEELVNEVIQ